MKILSSRNHLARQIKANVRWYNHQAAQRKQGTLSPTWVKYVAKLDHSQWNALKHGSSSLPLHTYKGALKLIQTMEQTVLGETYHSTTKSRKSRPHRTPKPDATAMTQAKQNMRQTLNRLANNKSKRPNPHNQQLDRAKRNLQTVLASIQNVRPHRSKRVITLIKAQKHKNRFNVYVNGRYAFPAGINELSRYHLTIGMPISRSLQKRVSESADVSKMFNRASTRIVHHLQTEREIHKWLRQKYNCSEDDVELVIKKLKNYHLIDDAHYAHEYIRAEIVSGSKGPEAIARHLRSKGIDSLTVQDALERFYPVSKQLVIAKHRAKDKFKMKVNTPFNKRLRKIKLSLVRKGFSFDIASQAVDECHFQPNHEHQEQLLNKYTRQAFRRYGHRLNRNNHYQIRMKIKRFLFRKGFDFDAIDQAIETYKQVHVDQ